MQDFRDDEPAVRGKPDAVREGFQHSRSIVRRHLPIPKSSGVHFESTADSTHSSNTRIIPPIYVNPRSEDPHDYRFVAYPETVMPRLQLFRGFPELEVMCLTGSFSAEN